MKDDKFTPGKAKSIIDMVERSPYYEIIEVASGEGFIRYTLEVNTEQTEGIKFLKEYPKWR